MSVYPIPENVNYKGAGHALAAITNDQIIKIVYMSDVIDEFSSDDFDFNSILDDSRLVSVVRELSVLGQVSFGMCSCGEFVEL